ncbi:unnamed protein product [Onchocerca ochengi]|uniref:isopentenyl-diphosphate Delta-isomerase n=1 Tax=Onchocerca ochengi TaxID=42157 RepID=A0A182E596_ONCOC|nr:unnamed protein product [Onchocerca ochengi]
MSKKMQKEDNLFKPSVLNVQSNYLDEQCITVDENDNPLRPESKRFCHSAETLTLHRAFSVFLFTKNREMIVQKRAAQKMTFPSVWTNACCSHPLWNEHEMCTDNNNIGIRRAAKRKLCHELGIDSDYVDIDQMKIIGRFLYKAMSDENWGEYEIDYVIVIRDFDPRQIDLNLEEVEAIAFISSMEELNEILKNTEEKFSPWFHLFVEENFLQDWWRDLDRLDELSDSQTIYHLN